MASYRVLTGIDYPPDKRAEAGDIVDDLPGKSIKWLVACGAIEKAEGSVWPKEEVVEETVEEEVVEEEVVEEAAAEEDEEEAASAVWPVTSAILDALEDEEDGDK